MPTLWQPSTLKETSKKRYSVYFGNAGQSSPPPWLALSRSSSTPTRSSRRSPPQALFKLPFTAEEWKRELLDIKHEYRAKNFALCTARCVEILDNLKCQEAVQPTYLIYLRFYAATSLEMQVRTSQICLSEHATLLQEARGHYRAASDLAQKAARQVSIIQESRSDSPSPTTTSPLESNSSYSPTSTTLSSPSPSLESSDDECRVPGMAHNSKSIMRTALSDIPEDGPFAATGSPTVSVSDQDESFSVACPLVLEKAYNDPTSFEDSTIPTDPSRANIVDKEPYRCHNLRVADQLPEEAPPSPRSLARYSIILNSIQNQIASHMASLEKDISVLSSEPSSPVITEENRAADIRTRIERLRANGWQRKRFDAERYERFREQIMSDIVE